MLYESMHYSCFIIYLSYFLLIFYLLFQNKLLGRMVFRSAFNYLSQAGTQLLTGQSEQHPLVGQFLDIDGKRYIVRALLAEGGFALVFSVQDSKTGEWFALKRQLAADKAAALAIKREIQFLKQLSGHHAIIHYHYSIEKTPEKNANHQYYGEFLLLTELCTGGTLIDYMKKAELSTEQVCKIFHAVSSAVRHMHDRNPPITHRDIKIENLLFDSHGFIRLCDFGSATTDIFRPDQDWNALMRSQLEEEMAKYTTPMYRAPEVLETYQNYPIGPAQDIWALGCVLFYLCYKVHPFEDSAKLRIINARYTLPPQSPFQIFHNLIRQTLQPDPYSRPSIQDLCEQIEDVAMALNINMSEPIVSPEQLIQPAGTAATSTSSANQSARLFFDQGMNLIKTIKEKSPVTNISEQLRSQLGFDSSAKGTNENEQKMAPPRPPAPPSIQTRVTPLTQKEPMELHPKISSSTRDNDLSRNAPKQHTKHTPPANDFFNSLDWNLNDKSALRQEMTKVQHESGQASSIIDGFEMFAKARQDNNEAKCNSSKHSTKATEFNIMDDFGHPNVQKTPSPNFDHGNKAGSSNDVDLLKLLEEEVHQCPTNASAIHRNKSTPNFTAATSKESEEVNQNMTADDIFAEFLSNGIGQTEGQFQEEHRKPNYSRKNFEIPEVNRKEPPKHGAAFDDLLSAQGFTSSAKQSNKTLADLVKDRDTQEMDPIMLKIKYWTDGKQRNIRALLGSLSEVLWDEAKGNWSQPNVAELFEPDKIKKFYRKACLVVHPDKQSGTVNEPLAKAIFTELNDAWNEFLKTTS